jgi:hypothetical protein
MNLMDMTFDKLNIGDILNVLEGGDSNIDMGRFYIYVVRMPVIPSHIEIKL